ncbi:fimbrial protein [Serratia fonticola]|uniref:fimbrial protein n=1 Tax=Serratia fonticola TaxID=47917 RepID=UPI003AADFC2C
MRHTFLRRHAVVLLPCIVLCASGVRADTDVEFSGTLVADPCRVETDSEAQTVEFGAIPAKTFIDAVQTVPKTFHVHLKECDLSLGSQVSFTFTGEKDAAEPTLFKVSGSATGIALAIEDSEGRVVTPDGEQQAVTLTEGDTTLTWRTRVQSTVGRHVGEGEFSSVVTFALRYD